MTGNVHKQLVQHLADEGWRTGQGWREEVRQHVLKEEFCGEPQGEEGLLISLTVAQAPVIPDAWRFVVEQDPGYDRLIVVEAVEVEVTNRLSDEKLDWYKHIWWRCDATAYIHFRLYVMDRFGNRHTLYDDTCPA